MTATEPLQNRFSAAAPFCAKPYLRIRILPEEGFARGPSPSAQSPV